VTVVLSTDLKLMESLGDISFPSGNSLNLLSYHSECIVYGSQRRSICKGFININVCNKCQLPCKFLCSLLVNFGS
jgi:hypothetical protein